MLEGLAPKSFRREMCGLIERAQTELNEADREILLGALENKLFSSLNLAEQLTERGFRISETGVRNHRRGKCACARKLK